MRRLKFQVTCLVESACSFFQFLWQFLACRQLKPKLLCWFQLAWRSFQALHIEVYLRWQWSQHRLDPVHKDHINHLASFLYPVAWIFLVPSSSAQTLSTTRQSTLFRQQQVFGALLWQSLVRI